MTGRASPAPTDLPRLGADRWSAAVPGAAPGATYDRADLPERVLQFGTGMLLRALPVALIDAANRAGQAAGRVVVVQSTPRGLASELQAQDGLFTLVEQGAAGGARVEHTRIVGAIARALVCDRDWAAVRALAASPELRVVVSNVTEAGFRPDDDELAADGEAWPRAGATGAPASFPAKLTDLLHTRFRHAPDAPPLFVIPTELVDDNGAQLRAMVERLSARYADGDAFRAWLARCVRFCSSLVDRITTGTPAPALHAALEMRLGYADALLTVTEPYALWAIECDPDELRAALPVDGLRPAAGQEPPVIVTPDISRYRERKIRLLNGAHTALAPLARLAGVRTVREVVEHPELGAFLRRILDEEIVPSMVLPAGDAEAFASAVLDRFANPWLDHEWSVIATNQTAKMRLRVVPSVVAFFAARGTVPQGLALAVAAFLRHGRCAAAGAEREGTGWWRGGTYALADADLPLVARHWHAAEGDWSAAPAAAPVAGPVAAQTARRVARSAAGDAALWGRSLAELPGFTMAVECWLHALERDGVLATLAALHDAAAAPAVWARTATTPA